LAPDNALVVKVLISFPPDPEKELLKDPDGPEIKEQ
jgi:hypothetical protein